MKTTVLKIEGMHCEGCADTIKALVEKARGVRMAAVSLESGEARILFDPTTIGEDEIVAVVQRPGYRVVQSR